MYLFSLHVPRSSDHFYIHCILLSIYMMMYVFLSYFTCVVSFLTLYTCFFFYTTCLCFTLDALMNLVLSVSVKTGCKSTLLLKKKKKVASLPCHDLSSCKVFQEFVVGLNLYIFVGYGDRKSVV